MQQPERRPKNPCFGAGPTAKRPGWSPDVLSPALLSRSHRSAGAKGRLKDVLDRSRALLGLPDSHRIGIVPASDTGAFEMAMWSLLGARGADVLAWESFGKGWVTDAVKQLELSDLRVIEADYGDLPDLGTVDPARDVVFTWNGTTSGVRVPDGDWIAAGRTGLTLADATSAVFAMPIPWDKVDVATYSFQKVLGGEAQHGVLILGPRAVERLESYSPPWPLPKIFRLTKGGALIEGIFKGETINTPSMLVIEDMLDALRWAESVGGGDGLIARTEANFGVVADWVERTPWVEFLARDPATRSPTSICLSFAPDLVAPGQHGAVSKRMVQVLSEMGIAHDIGSYREAPPGLRLWGGATVESADLEALLPWLDWAFEDVRRSLA